jgi:hypothetical protein
VKHPNGEEFLLRVCYTTTPSHCVRHAEVMADMGIEPPDPLPTSDEMQHVAFAAKMAMLKVLRDRKRKKKVSPGEKVKR